MCVSLCEGSLCEGTAFCDDFARLLGPCAQGKVIANETTDDETTDGETNDNETHDVLSYFKKQVSAATTILILRDESRLEDILNSFRQMAEQDLPSLKEAVLSKLDELFDYGKDDKSKYFHREMLGLVDNLDFGANAYIMQALCPTPEKSYGAEVHFSMTSDELPPGFDPTSCPSTRVMQVFEKHLLDLGAFLVKINIRDLCDQQKNGKNCKAPTAAECTPRALALNLLGMLYTAVGGSIHFANVGGPAIKTSLTNRLYKPFFKSIEGTYHISLATSMTGGLLGKEDEHIVKISCSFKEICDAWDLPELFSELVEKCRYLEHPSKFAELAKRLKEEKERREKRIKDITALRKLPRNSEERKSALLRMKSENDSGFCNAEGVCAII